MGILLLYILGIALVATLLGLLLLIWLWRRWPRFAALLLALILTAIVWKALPVIDYFTGKTIHWKQEAPLHDGRMLIVERVSELGPSALFLQSMRMEIKQTLSFKHPDTGEKISWTIPDGLQPAMIDFEQGVPWFLMITAMSSDYSKWGCPNPPYLAYRYQNGKWKHVAFEEFPASLEWLNLFTSSSDPMNKGGLLPEGSYVQRDQLEQFWGRVDLHRGGLGSPKPGEEARRFSRDKLSPEAFSEECDLNVVMALGRVAEMSEERQVRYRELTGGMDPQKFAEYQKTMEVERIRNELKERLK
jgi:hypothetical protein